MPTTKVKKQETDAFIFSDQCIFSLWLHRSGDGAQHHAMLQGRSIKCDKVPAAKISILQDRESA